jgi:toluene monooxygenase system ferredoxin subunit
MAYTPVVALADLWDGDMAPAVVDGRKVVVIRLDGTVYAYEDRCAHLGVALSEGRLEGTVLTCRAHEWQYDPRSGQGVNAATACLRRFAVRVDHGRVFVDVGEAGA